MGKGMLLNMCVQTMVSTGRVIEVEEAWLVWRASIRARNCNSLNGLNRQKEADSMNGKRLEEKVGVEIGANWTASN